MRKIILAVNTDQVNHEAIHYACKLANETKSKLFGVFVDDVVLELTPPLDEFPPYYGRVTRSPNLVEEVSVGMEVFREICRKFNVPHELIHNTGIPLEEIIGETKFADLLIVDLWISFEARSEKIPNQTMKQILSQSHCPVIIAPLGTHSVQEIVFCYDRSESSIFALKQFSYLFPQYSSKKITVLEIQGERTKVSGNEDRKLKSWIHQYYSDVHFSVIHGGVDDYLFSYLYKRPDAFVIMGAYGRGWISRIIRESTADKVLRIADLPLFIAHK